MKSLLWILGIAVVLLFLVIVFAIEDNNKWKDPAKEKDIFRIRFF